MGNLVVSMDYDSTLSKKHVQEYAKELLERGIEIWIITSRYDDLHLHKYDNPLYDNTDIFAVADELGIPRWKIRFTCMDWKSEYILNTKILWHLDDDEKELYHLKNSGSNTVGIQVESGSWKSKCERLIKRSLG